MRTLGRLVLGMLTILLVFGLADALFGVKPTAAEVIVVIVACFLADLVYGR